MNAPIQHQHFHEFRSTSAAPPFADPPSPDSTDPKISAFFNVTFTSSRLVLWGHSTAEPAERRAGTALRPLLHPSRSLRHSPHHPYWEWVAPPTTITRWSLLRSWVVIFKELRNSLPSFMFILSITLPILSIRSVLSSIFINSHQETFSGQACNPPDPHWSFFFSIGGGVLRYLVPKWLLFLNLCGGCFFSLPA